MAAICRNSATERHPHLHRSLEPRPEEGSHDRTMVLNMGPQHPSTHGVLRLVIEIDGETVLKVVPDIGYLHTGIEKTCEAKFYQQVVPLTDRIDYLCPMTNNLGYCLAVEKLLQIEIPERAQWIRVLLNELTRLNSHLVWLGTHAMDIGALTVFLYTFREREEILRIFEAVSRPADDDLATSAWAGWRWSRRSIYLIEFRSYQNSSREDRRISEPADRQSDLDRASEGRGTSERRGCDRAGRDRASAARVRRGLGPAARHAVFELREIPVQSADLERLRCVGALHHPHRRRCASR